MRFSAFPVLMDENVHCAPVLEKPHQLPHQDGFSKASELLTGMTMDA